MSPLAFQFKDNYYVAGISFIVASIIIFLLPSFSAVATGDSFGIFAVNFLITATYFLILLVGGKLKRRSGNIHLVFLFLILFLISAYSLNREMSVFQQSTTWMCVLLTACCINYISFAFFSKLPNFIKHFMCFLLAISTLLFLYLGIYLIPLYAIGAGAFFLLGISLHTFVPLMFIIYSIVLIRKMALTFKAGLFNFTVGIAAVILLTAVFVTRWNNIVTTINHEYRKQLVDGDQTLPAWVRISQKLEASPITERVLKAGLSYALPADDFSFASMPQRNFGEEQKHDPLVMLSAMTTERVQLSSDEKINILRSLYDSRHQAEERLWSGENLITSHVNTRLKMWPALRMAYTEKIVTVTNKNTEGWGSSEEAIYTFHLPEGGVVTSLSLWINGKEEKAILTSKEKAATAYKTIVGVEQRDPSIIQWQEGNRVSVRVFPVLRNESRMFKIGITSPVGIKTDDLVYDNIWFDGPAFSTATEDIKAEILNANNVIIPSSFTKTSINKFEHEGGYKANWNISCALQPISTNSFSFDDHVYSVQPYKIDRQPAMMDNVYLDVNSSWTYSEFTEVWEAVKSKNVYVVINDEIQQVSMDNITSLYPTLSNNRFSLFPFYKIKNAAAALVITKCEEVSPNLDELEGSQFLKSIYSGFSPANKYRVFNLSSIVSPYLASLKEKRFFDYEAGTLKDLNEAIRTNTFAVQHENEEEVIIHQAAIKLVKKQGALEQSTAPDHLMRLFTYNHIMQQLGEQPMPSEDVSKQLTLQARQSYIVTPLTSLVVLESKADYDRFDIKDENNSLKNASLKSTGAVPEPHEWALIILAITILLYAKYPFLFKRFLWKA